jgi:WD40 repeat protein
MAALEAATGNAMLWNPGPNQVVSSLSLSPDGSTLYAGGDFTILNFQPQNYLAAITASTGLPTTWKPNPGSTVYKVLATGSAVYAGGTFTTIGSQAPAPARNYIAALDPASGNATNWNPDAGSTVRSIAVSGDGETVYLGGLFGTINGATTRNNVAAVNTTTGVANGWDPDAGGEVYSILPSGPVVYTGGDFNSIGGQYRKGFAALDAATGAAR